MSTEQLSVLIETLFHEVVNRGSASAKAKLQKLFFELSSTRNTQMISKLTAVLYFIEGKYLCVKTTIQVGKFDKCHHAFLQQLYRDSSSKMNETDFQDNYYFWFPISIDPLGEDGLPESLSTWLNNYCQNKRNSKKALNVEKVAEFTKLSVEKIEKRFTEQRKLMPAPHRKSKKLPESNVESKIVQQKSCKAGIDCNIYHENLENLNINMYYPSPPMFSYDMFPTYRVPIDQPLTIMIPDS